MKMTLLFALFLGGFAFAQTDTTSAAASYDCKYSKNEVDDFTGDTKIVTEPELFVAHTDSSLMKYYKRKKHQYLEIEFYTGRVNEAKGLYLFATIQTKKAYEYYGSLRSDAKIMFKMSNGEMIELKFLKSDAGDMDYDGNKTTYSNVLGVTDEEVETFINNDVEKIRVYWSKGYEDYDVDNKGLLRKQFSCLAVGDE